MSTINRIKLMQRGIDNLETHKELPNYRKKKSEETKIKEYAEKTYVRKSNLCSTCYTYKSTLTGECNC